MRHQSRRGALLPSVLAAMVLIGLAASAGFFMTGRERAASDGVRLATTAVAAADEVLVTALASMSPRAHALRPGEASGERVPIPGADVAASARILRLGETVFALHVDAQAFAGRGTAARRRATLLLRLDPPIGLFAAALSLAPDGTAPDGVASGDARASADSTCPAGEQQVPDVTHPSPLPADSAATSDLRARATFTFDAGTILLRSDPVTVAGECATSVSSNWGDPRGAGACASFHPIVHGTGDLTVHGGSGQGVLVVDGDLSLSGGFAFAGAIIVAGTLHLGAGGASITGGVRAGSVVDARGVDDGGAAIQYSSCALRTALLATAAQLPVRERPWSAER